MKRAFIAASLALFASASHAYTIDFGNAPPAPNDCSANTDGSGAFVTCTDFGRINQAYGDVPGVVNVTYSDYQFTTELRSLEWWDTQYNNLYGVAFSEGGSTNSYARVELAALAQPLLLTHFDLGAWSNATNDTHLNVYDLGTSALLFTYTGPVGFGSTSATPFNFALVSTTGFRIEFFNDAYNVGIDNITFSTTALIPEPETYAMFMAGLALLGFVAKRRTRRAAV